MAESLARRTGAVWLQADAIARELAPAPNNALEGHVHAEMLRRARRLLQAGTSVVLDASWSNPTDRADARRLVNETATTIAEICCTVPAAEAKERIGRRIESMHTVPDTDPDADAVADQCRNWPEAVRVDTRGAVDESVNQACCGIGLAGIARPRSLAFC